MNIAIVSIGAICSVLILGAAAIKLNREVKERDEYIKIQEKSIEVLIKTCEDWKSVYEIQRKHIELNQKMLENIKPRIVALN